MQAGATGTEGQGGCDTTLLRGPHAADPEAQCCEVLTGRRTRGSPASGGEEEEPRTFLVCVAEWTTVWIRACTRHAATLTITHQRCLTNPGNNS